ncbi:hypothetical protein [Chryseobacterium sp.]|uniref:hypothetical protein n=1 Tax=Chryseobacterium sp. TaxID=1871047 RepID=UPI0011C6F730|nr:hypothetical protein [Chryseobacterium sp.]TXF77511.1 hypothetical protein FUA25_06175 [Chryseobacterium sp.]
MKKTLFIIGIVISTAAFGQKKDYKFFQNDHKQPDYSTARAPGDPGDPVPIDSYIPLLLIAGLALAARYAKRQSSTIESADKN